MKKDLQLIASLPWRHFNRYIKSSLLHTQYECSTWSIKSSLFIRIIYHSFASVNMKNFNSSWEIFWHKTSGSQKLYRWNSLFTLLACLLQHLYYYYLFIILIHIEGLLRWNHFKIFYMHMGFSLSTVYIWGNLTVF